MSPISPLSRSFIRPRNAFCFLAALLLVFGPSSLTRPRTAQAATHIPTTTYSTNTTWTVANSPYVVDGDVTVAAGATLTIDPGVIVKLSGQFRTLRVNGTLTAIGTESSPITFTSYQDDSAGGDTNGDGAATSGAPGQWYHIEFKSSTSRLEYATVRYGGYGSAQNYAPIYVYGTGYGVTLDHATITNNQKSAVMVGSRATVTITNSTLSDNQYGLYVDLGTATIDHTTIANNSSRGIWFNLPTFNPLPAATNITNSEITANTGNGVYVGVNGDYPLASMPSGAWNNIYGNNSNGVQLDVVGYPAFKNANVNWRGNYWGSDVTFTANPIGCADATPNATGHLTYGSSTSGPIAGGSYLLPPQYTTTCYYDRFAIGPCQFLSEPISADAGEIDFAQPKEPADALDCAQQAAVTPLQLESDLSSEACPDLHTGYVVDPAASTTDIAADYEPMTRSLVDELNSFETMSCPYSGSPLVNRMMVQTSAPAPTGSPTIPGNWYCSGDAHWWPSSGTIQTGPSYRPGYIGQRFIYQTFKWNASNLSTLVDECSYKATYEPDAVFYNYDGLHYFGKKRSWLSNLPRKYNDTNFKDSENELVYTVGTANALQLVAGKDYATLIRTDPGNADIDTGKLVGQAGIRVPSICYSTWCVYPKDSEFLIDAWDYSVPGFMSWSHP